jgi:hypothetical protein
VRVFFEIRIGEKRDLRRSGVEFEQVELRAVPISEPFAELGHGDAEQRGDVGRIIAGIEQIDRAGQALAVGQRVEGRWRYSAEVTLTAVPQDGLAREEKAGWC